MCVPGFVHYVLGAGDSAYDRYSLLRPAGHGVVAGWRGDGECGSAFILRTRTWGVDYPCGGGGLE